jgi:hypothetical protein
VVEVEAEAMMEKAEEEDADTQEEVIRNVRTHLRSRR